MDNVTAECECCSFAVTEGATLVAATHREACVHTLCTGCARSAGTFSGCDRPAEHGCLCDCRFGLCD